MKKWSLRRPLWQRVLGYLPFFLAAGAVCIFTAYISCFFLKNAFRGNFDWMTFLTGLLEVPFSLGFAFTCAMITQSCFVEVWFTSQGVRKSFFGRTLCAIAWDDLAETGIALQPWPRGFICRCLYFSERHLDEEERAYIDDMDTSDEGAKLVFVRCKGLRNIDKLAELCPIPVPDVREPQSNKYDLITYRRDRLPNGAWGDIGPEFCPDADKVLTRLLSRRRAKRAKK